MVYSLEIITQDDNPMIEVWLTNAEQQDSEVNMKLKELYKKAKAENKMVVVFKSGKCDFIKNTGNYLAFHQPWTF